MPDHRRHRGAHPQDGELFAPATVGPLRQAAGDLSWLLGRGYAMPSSLKIVGDRYNLAERQRMAIMRAACADADAEARRARMVRPEALSGQPIAIDGYNVLTTVESALAGGVILACRDGCYRDLASMHGSWRRVEETPIAARLIGHVLAPLGIAHATWYLDSPVSNSGRLKALLQEVAREEGWDWDIQLVVDPDPVLSHQDQIIATADSVILDRCGRWINLARWVVEARAPAANLLDLAMREARADG